MGKTYRSLIFWGIAALVCLIMLVQPGYAATISDIPGYVLGPGDHYDEKGNILALNGKTLVLADGTIVDEDLEALAKSWAALNSMQGEEGGAAALIASVPMTPAQEKAKAEAEAKAAAEAEAAEAARLAAELKAAEAKAAEEAAKAAEAAKQTVVSEAAKPETQKAGAADSTKAAAEGANYTVAKEGDRTVYTYEGKKYVCASSYGVHKLSGFNPTAKYGAKTFSGKEARAHHTVAAASDLPIGTVLILKASSGPYPSEFDGVYVVEDRGGYHIEQEGWIDIFFDTEAEADHVTAKGWNYAEVWIAEEVK